MGRGNMQILLPMGGTADPTKVTLTNVYYALQMAYMLISVSQMDERGLSIHIEDKTCTVHMLRPEACTIRRIPLLGGLYQVNTNQMRHLSNFSMSPALNTITILQLHCLMGHANHESLKKMV
jgi:hypothetical protein